MADLNLRGGRIRTAEAMLEAGLLRDAISSDVHTLSINGLALDQLVTMSKFLALGCLSVGAAGDTSVLELVEGRDTAQLAAARGARAGGRRPMVASAAVSGSGSVRRPTRRG